VASHATGRERLQYAFAETSAGRVLLARSTRGLAWLSFVESDEGALEELTKHFRRADLEPASDRSATWIAEAVSAIESSGRTTLPSLDLGGTPFQRSVWEALLAIPFGQTRSYSQVAAAIGRPTAVRAVAQACGANPVAILVPCHRVVGADGSLTGYASGLARKSALLEHEGWRPPTR
jgi:AraC family transcriptional regulator of adaptative response/methylated-DNA-[protein]-cysteine methyltransferase